MTAVAGCSVRRFSLAILLMGSIFGSAFGQSNARQMGKVLEEEIVSPEVAVFQLRQYLLGRVAQPPSPSSAGQWSVDATHLRQHLLNDVIFHGWPKEWIAARPKFEAVGPAESGQGYLMRKLRYEVVPGFQSTAILYEPANLNHKVPAILNVNGHVGPPGKAVEYKQKRCINFAKHGIIALNLEWLGMGELGQEENNHLFGAHLDLVGTNEVGLFYLEMRRGLDCFGEHPNVDRSRLGMTGLSGGGWQTVVLSSLDERVAVSVPVAGFSSIRSRLEARWFGDLGDVEQYPTDLFDGVDYPHLVALRAPRPTLLIYNAEDDACFRAPMVKPYVFDAIRPLFSLYGKDATLDWHENTDPSTHNYQLDNRLHAYRFFSRGFGLPPIENELPSDAEIKSYDELVVGLPAENLTILGLARKLAKQRTLAPWPSDPSVRASQMVADRQRLREVVRYKSAEMKSVWSVANTKNKGVETRSYLFEMDDGLSASGVWAKAIATGDTAPVTIILQDQGNKAAGSEVSDRLNRGEQVLAVDLIFTGDAWSKITQGPFYRAVGPYLYEQILDGVGDRPIGLEAAQLIRIAHWTRDRTGVVKLRMETGGIRSQVAALIASALEPDLFSEIVVRDGMRSLSYLLELPVLFEQAPELFCLDLYKDFDIDRLKSLAPAKVSTTYVEASQRKPPSTAETRGQ